MFLEMPFDDIAIGACWTSRGRTITETDIVLFAGLSGDWFPLHTDREYAATTPFGARIAHGMLVLSVASGLIPLPAGRIVAFYGMDRVRFTRPVFIGDTIHARAEVVEKTVREDGRGLLTILEEVRNQRQETVAVFTAKILMQR
jgi:acyl dehydratase